MDKYLVTREEIDAYEGLSKTHFLNENAKRVNKSLGDLTGLSALGFHIIEVKPGHESTELHMHHHEEECVCTFWTEKRRPRSARPSSG